jgi:hypothetical protein
MAWTVDKYVLYLGQRLVWMVAHANRFGVCLFVFTYPVSVIVMLHFKASFLEIIPILMTVT